VGEIPALPPYFNVDAEWATRSGICGFYGRRRAL